MLCVAVVLTEGADSDVWLGLAFVLLLIPIAFIDLDHRIIPNKLTALGAVVAIVLVAIFQTDDLVEHLIAAAAAGGFLLIAAIVYPAGMGMGDVKLAAVMGLFLGRAVGPAMLVALIAGSLVGIVVIRRHGRKAGVPFGPFLAFGGHRRPVRRRRDRRLVPRHLRLDPAGALGSSPHLKRAPPDADKQREAPAPFETRAHPPPTHPFPHA